MRKADSNPDKCYFRVGDRFVNQEGAWWFSVREGEDQGPFPSREAAELALQRYIDGCDLLTHMKEAPAKNDSDSDPAPDLSIDTSY